MALAATYHACVASGGSSGIATLPAHATLAEHSEPLPYLVGFGEEYELFAASPANRDLVCLRAMLSNDDDPIGQIHADCTRRPTHHDWPTPLFAHFAETQQ